MLDYFPCSSPAFSSFPDHAQKYPFTHAAQQQPHYSPAPSTFTFDPFADDDADDASESSQSHVARSERVEFLRQREWMRRVAAWVEGVHSQAPAATPSYGMHPYNPRAVVPVHAVHALSGALRGPEPYVIYSTPLPGGTPTSSAPVKAAPSQAKKQPTPTAVPPRHVHSRVPSLDSIREEDEDRFS
ncbi:hypothetical protein EWM64_g9932 [Hericium alpestre]|uniref:Uncharacterized protein n=1 Tax=Hericium alpestre TaxID=135208 RepID=A0A4Y9ZIT7_9AGAM|nr:hypothetical protein EWM64_g9932 [Hericium alpestre]